MKKEWPYLYGQILRLNKWLKKRRTPSTNKPSDLVVKVS